MDCFGDIIKTNNNFDKTLNTTISRFSEIKRAKILITENVNLAASYVIGSGFNPSQSLSFPQLNRLSLPLIAVKDDIYCLFAVQEPNLLSKWSSNLKKDKIEKHSFATKIVGLIGSIYKRIPPIVVYENGFCQLISNAINTKTEEKKQRVISEDESIQFIDYLMDKKSTNNLIIYLITKSKSSSDSIIKSIYKLSLNLESDELVKTEKQLVVNKLSNWCLCPKTSTILSATRFEGDLIIFQMDGKNERKLFELNSSSIQKVYSLVTTSVGSICIIGKTKDNTFVIELWETRYVSMLGTMTLPYEPLTNDCNIIDDNKVFITCLNGIVLIPIKTQSICLSQIVGKDSVKKPVLESELNQQLNKICDDFDSKSDQSLEELNESFTDIVRQISGNIPEDMILKLLIICSQKMRQNKSQSLKNFFERLVCLPFNELFMISKLKSSKIKTSEIHSILESLIDSLPSNNCAVIDWISILIDSHMNHFILNPSEDTIKAMEQLMIKIDNYCQLCEQLGSTKILFEILLSKNMNKRAKCGSDMSKPQKGQYCIEILRL